MGTAYRFLGNHVETLSHYQQALQIFREIGEKRLEGTLFGDIGMLYLLQGNHEEALSHLQQAIASSREIEAQVNLGRYLGNMGLLYVAQGNHEAALSHYQQALAISRKIGETESEGMHLGNMGDLLVKLQRPEEAKDAFQKSIVLCDESFIPAAGASRASLALLLAQEGRLEEALSLLQAAEPQVHSLPTEFGKFLCKKAQVYHLNDDFTGAKAALQQAQVIADELDVQADSELAKLLHETQELL